MEYFRGRFDIPVSDDDVARGTFYRPQESVPEMAYMHERRRVLGGYMPAASWVRRSSRRRRLSTSAKCWKARADPIPPPPWRLSSC